MKNFRIILAASVIMFLSLTLILSAQSQDTISKIYVSKADQEWLAKSEFIIAYHGIPKELHPWEDLEIFEISVFIDKSMKNGTLAVSNTGASDREGLNILKNKINSAEYALNNGTFEETCRHLLEAYLITDGLDQPPDLVYGKAAPELAKMIEYMKFEIVGCE
jgi:hypothetical protein